jgi:Zn-dependent protease with chaperone function
MERPLAAAARGSLVLAAAGTMLVFYAMAAVSIVLLLLLLVVLALVLLGAARFGLAAYVTPLMRPPSTIVGILGRNLWLPTPVHYRVPLRQPEAPRFFAMASDLAERLGVPRPTSVVVEMHAGAWVQLKGVRRAAGKSTLGIGFDLLAGLTTAEVGAVLGHELAHARLVNRGFARWLNNAMARLANVSRQLGMFEAAGNSADEASELAKWMNRLFDALTVRAARLVATYSRQDEFDADRAAAEACGTAAMHSALSKLHALDDAAGRLPWNERFARVAPGENFSQWLSHELGWLMERADHEPAHHAADPYSTHPTVRDRIAALPADGGVLKAGANGLSLLAKPDDVADRLAVEIRRVAADQEAKHSKAVAKETEKFCKRTGSRWELVGWLLVGTAVLIAAMLVVPPNDDSSVVIAVMMLVVGLSLVRGLRYRDRWKLPVPAYGTLAPATAFPTNEALEVAEKTIADELRAQRDTRRGKRGRLDVLTSAAYRALEERDYLRAHVAARLALEIDDQSVEASLGYAIAAASFGGVQQAHQAVGAVRYHAGLMTPATRWGVAWAMCLLGDENAEGLLERLHRDEPRVATYPALLARTQLSRGKVHSAIRNARTACRLAPANEAGRHLLVEALLAAGDAPQAAAEAKPQETAGRSNPRAAFLMVRVRLMQRDVVGASGWAATLRTLDASESAGEWLIGLGAEFARARLDEQARGFFTDALATPYHAQANIGLADIEQGAGNRAQARAHLLAALKLTDSRFIGDETPGVLFHSVLERLNALEARREPCRAWIATVPAGAPSPLAGASLLVCAPELASAMANLAEITTAMQTGDTPLEQATITWKEAPKDRQPLRPVAPGVQLVLDE